MITSINEILIEWAYRTRDGKPDPKSMSHQIILEGILREFGWNIEQRGELLKNLQEVEPKDKEPELDDREKQRAKDMGLIWKGKGYGKENEDGITHHNVGGKLVKVGEKPEGDQDGKDDDSGKLSGSDFERGEDGEADTADDGGGDEPAEEPAEEKIIPVEQQPKSKILRDKNGRIETIDGKDKRLTKGVVTGDSTHYNQEFGKEEGDAEPPDTNDEGTGFYDKTPDENQMGHPNKPVPNPKADLENSPEMKKLLKLLGSPPYKFPKKYLKLISRMLNSHGGVAAVTKLTNYIKGGGAGQINSQAGELLTVIGSSMPNEPKDKKGNGPRDRFFNIIEKHLDSQMDPKAKPPTAPTDVEFQAIYDEPNATKRLRMLQKLQSKYPHLKIDSAKNKKRIKAGKELSPSMKNWKEENMPPDKIVKL
jgi:hypothetical protein